MSLHSAQFNANRVSGSNRVVLQQAIANLVLDHTELYKQFEDNPSFKQWLNNSVFKATYQPPAQR